MAFSTTGYNFDQFVTQQLSNASGVEEYRISDADQHHRRFMFILLKQNNSNEFSVMFIMEPFMNISAETPCVTSIMFDSRDTAENYIQNQRNKIKGLSECVESKNNGFVSADTGMLTVIPRHNLVDSDINNEFFNKSIERGFRGVEEFRKEGKTEAGQLFVLVVTKLDYYIVRVVLEPDERWQGSFDAKIDWYSCTVHLPQIKERTAIDNWIAQTRSYDGKRLSTVVNVFLPHPVLPFISCRASRRCVLEFSSTAVNTLDLKLGDHISTAKKQDGIYIGNKLVVSYSTDSSAFKPKGHESNVITVTLDEFMNDENTLYLKLYRSPDRCGDTIVETAQCFDETVKNSEMFVFRCTHKMKLSTNGKTYHNIVGCLTLYSIAIVIPLSIYLQYFSIAIYISILLLLLWGACHMVYCAWLLKIQEEMQAAFLKLYLTEKRLPEKDINHDQSADNDSNNGVTNFGEFVTQKLKSSSGHEIYQISENAVDGQPFTIALYKCFGIKKVIVIKQPPTNDDGRYTDDGSAVLTTWFWFRSSADDYIQQQRNQLMGLPKCVEMKRNGLVSKENGNIHPSNVTDSSQLFESQNRNSVRFKKFEAFVLLSVSLGFRGGEVYRKYGITNAGQYFVFVVSKIDYYIVRVVLEPDERFNGTLLEKMHFYSCTIHLPRIKTSEQIDNWVKETSAHFVSKQNYILNDWARDAKQISTTLRELETRGLGLKPGDHIRRNLKFWKILPTYHDGIYIGNGKVTHYTTDSTLKIMSSKNGSGVSTVSIEEFLKGETKIYLVLYRSPDRSGDKIVEKAQKCAASNVWHGSYHLAYRNCHLFASFCVRENENPKPKSIPEVKQWVWHLLIEILVALTVSAVLISPPYPVREWIFDIVESVTFLYGTIDLQQFPERSLHDIFLDDWTELMEFAGTTYSFIIFTVVIGFGLYEWHRRHQQSNAWDECKTATTTVSNVSSDMEPLLEQEGMIEMV